MAINGNVAKKSIFPLARFILINTVCITYTQVSLANNADTIFACQDTLQTAECRNLGGVLDRISSSRAYKMMYIGTPLIVGGLIVKSEDDHFRSLRNDYMPKFNHHLDDYMQFGPAVVMLGMKAFKVKGRSSWNRMLTSDAFSAILMSGIVYAVKQTTNVTRPDGSNNRSFPSGHTATAFMTATMLTKEYGYISPWIGFGAYSMASATGLMRMANNKHWLSDVMTGAGIGILSTELGYYLADIIFKDKGINEFANNDNFSREYAPSFISLYIGLNVPLSGYDLDDKNTFSTSSGSTVGVEGAYFFNKYLGVGGRFTVSNTSIIVNGKSAETETFDASSLCLGGYFSYPLSNCWTVGSKLLGGYTYYPKLTLQNQVVQSNSGICFGSGISLTFRAKEHYGIKFFLDYNLSPSHSRNSREYMNTLVLGSSFSIFL